MKLLPNLPDFFDLWVKWRNEANTRRYNPMKDEPEAELKNRFLKTGSNLSDLKSAEEFRFFVSHENEIVGNVSLKNISHMMMYGEIGYGPSQDYQGRGLGTQAVRLFVEKLFSETSLRRIFAYVAEDNLPSCRLLERIGFFKEGICRDHYIVNGKPTNEILYGLLRSDLTDAPKVTVRMATEADSGDILRVHFEAVHVTAAKDYSSDVINQWSTEVNPERTSRYLKESFPEETTVVAEVQGRIIGFGAIVERLNELRAVYVSSRSGRMGAGTAILGRLEELATARGLNELKMVSSLTAEKFYAKHGYQVLGRGQHTLRTGLIMPCVKMRKSL